MRHSRRNHETAIIEPKDENEYVEALSIHFVVRRQLLNDLILDLLRLLLSMNLTIIINETVFLSFPKMLDKRCSKRSGVILQGQFQLGIPNTPRIAIARGFRGDQIETSSRNLCDAELRCSLSREKPPSFNV